MAHGGEALGRLDNGKVVFVPYALPGERVRLRVVDQRSAFDRGRVVQLLRPSPHRVTPQCPYFGACGGCQWQHVSYSQQLTLKRQVIQEQLRRVAGLEQVEVLPTIAARNPWGYRNRLRLVADAEGRLGLRQARSHEPVAIERCPVSEAPINGFLRARSAGYQPGAEVTVACSPGNDRPMVTLAPPGQPGHLLAGSPAYLEETFMGRTLRASPGAFFQVNSAQLVRLVHLVLREADLSGGERVVDAYAGVGTFAVFLAERAGLVVAIERDPVAAEDARWNCRDLPNVKVECRAVAEALDDLTRPLDVVVLDPPRGGCEPEVLREILRLAPRRVVYVSCDPATLARDVAQLLADYVPERVQPIDLFPQTSHVECVALLTRRPGRE